MRQQMSGFSRMTGGTLRATQSTPHAEHEDVIEAHPRRTFYPIRHPHGQRPARTRKEPAAKPLQANWGAKGTG